jgi:hypothetical protein
MTAPKEYSRRYLSEDERIRLADLRREKRTIREIGRLMGRAPSTISRELRRGVDARGRYHPFEAQRRALGRRRLRRTSRLAADPVLRDWVATKLKARWSPEQIAIRLRRQFPEEPARWLCAETIYQAVYRPDLGGLPRELPGRVLRRRRRQRVRRRDAQRRRSGPVTGMTMIHDRDATVLERGEVGHWRHEPEIREAPCTWGAGWYAFVMASFGGIELGRAGSAVFELTSETDDEDYTHSLEDGATVTLPRNSQFVVVRDCLGDSAEAVERHGREAANRSIDLHYGQGGRPLLLAHKDSPSVVAWPTAAGQTIRVVGRVQLSFRFRARPEVLDSEGNFMIQPPTPPKVWHPSLRYYRVAEASADLFDSFRNVYLALEALLSSVVPPEVRADGRMEGDGAWLGRALREVGVTVGLDPYAPESGRVPHNAIHQELYVDLRTAMFHAKSDRPTWNPQDWQTRALITEARARYARLFRALAAQYLDIGYPGGGMSKAFWENSFENQLSTYHAFVSNDPTPISAEPKGRPTLAPAGGTHLILDSRLADELRGDWRRGVIGTAASEEVIQAVGVMQRFGSMRDDELAIVECLQAPLSVEGSSTTQIALVVDGRNYGQPRIDFES